jgi:hypothetical protein
MTKQRRRDKESVAKSHREKIIETKDHQKKIIRTIWSKDNPRRGKGRGATKIVNVLRSRVPGDMPRKTCSETLGFRRGFAKLYVSLIISTST